jgi:chemotaxis protein MotB
MGLAGRGSRQIVRVGQLNCQTRARKRSRSDAWGMDAVATVRGSKGVRDMKGVMKLGVFGVLVSAVMGMTGCLNQSQYDRVSEAYSSCEAKLKEVQRERDEARLSVDQLRSTYGKGEGALASLQRENQDLRSQLDRAMSDYGTMQQRISGLTFGPLDQQTTNDLTDLASKYNNLIAFDAQRGMLRISADLTFDSGSAAVKQQARQALSELAGVLNSGSAGQYDVIVEGHTDSQRMANPATIREHKSNRGLACNRAISVIDVLSEAGVTNGRLMAAGWGEHRPAVSNNSNGNTPANRRVEIYLAKLNPAMGGAMPMGNTPAGNTGANAVTPAYDNIK